MKNQPGTKKNHENSTWNHEKPWKTMNNYDNMWEDVVEEPPQGVVPVDFEDRANNEYYHDLKKVDEAMKIPGKTEKCCFCV